MGASKYHTHASRFGGRITRTVCGRHFDDIRFIKPPEWFRDHPYPDAIGPAICNKCRPAIETIGLSR